MIIFLEIPRYEHPFVEEENMEKTNVLKSLIIRNSHELPRISPYEFEASAPSGQKQFKFGSVTTVSETTLAIETFSTPQSMFPFNKGVKHDSFGNK